MERHPFNGVKTPPPAVDASMKPPTMKSTVNNDTTRSKAAPTDKTLGPRAA
jgi:hypothetical protein